MTKKDLRNGGEAPQSAEPNRQIGLRRALTLAILLLMAASASGQGTPNVPAGVTGAEAPSDEKGTPSKGVSKVPS